MKPDVVLVTPRAPEPGAFDGRRVAVIDVLRATSTIVAAPANDARAGEPTEPSEAAVGATTASRKPKELGHGDDVVVRATVDRCDVVPELHDRQLALPQPIDPACSRRNNDAN